MGSLQIRGGGWGVETSAAEKFGQIPRDIKMTGDLPKFKRKIRLWKPTKCPCRLCKCYIASIGYIDGVR